MRYSLVLPWERTACRLPLESIMVVLANRLAGETSGFLRENIYKKEKESKAPMAIHQVCCLYSHTPGELSRSRSSSTLQALRLRAIQQLLLDNSRVTPRFLHWCAYFPGTFHTLVQNPIDPRLSARFII